MGAMVRIYRSDIPLARNEAFKAAEGHELEYPEVAKTKWQNEFLARLGAADVLSQAVTDRGVMAFSVKNHDYFEKIMASATEDWALIASFIWPSQVVVSDPIPRLSRTEDNPEPALPLDTES